MSQEFCLFIFHFAINQIKHLGCKKNDCNGASALLGIINLRNCFGVKSPNARYLVFFNGKLGFQEREAANSELTVLKSWQVPVETVSPYC